MQCVCLTILTSQSSICPSETSSLDLILILHNRALHHITASQVPWLAHIGTYEGTHSYLGWHPQVPSQARIGTQLGTHRYLVRHAWVPKQAHEGALSTCYNSPLSRYTFGRKIFTVVDKFMKNKVICITCDPYLESFLMYINLHVDAFSDLKFWTYFSRSFLSIANGVTSAGDL